VAAQKFANNASSLLAASITDIETSIQVDAGYGALFPNPGAGEFFLIALENSAGNVEICKVTTRVADLFTVVRGFDNTTAQAWTNGVTRVELRNTAASMQQMIQRTGDVMEGDLNMDGNEVQNVTITGDSTIVEATVQGGVITNSNGDLTNAITIPDDGTSAPNVGGSPILTVSNFDPQSVFTAGMIMPFWGSLSDIPDGWALCDGNNGRPDLRNKFIVGVGTDYALGDTGGIDLHAGLATELGGDAVAATEEHVLTLDEMPAHQHGCGLGQQNDVTTAFLHGSQAGSAPESINQDSNNTTVEALTEIIGGGLGHAHDVAISPHTHNIATLDNRPPYVALYWIIKVDPAGSYGGAGTGEASGSMYDMYAEDGCNTFIGGQATLMDDVDDTAGFVQINCCASNVFRHVLTGSITMLAPNNPLSGQVINIILKQGGSGSYTVTWNPVFKWPGGSPPVLSTDVGAVDMVSCQFDSADQVWYCSPQAAFA
jgi:hypothetical protein